MSRDRYEMLEYDGKLYSEIQHLESENDDLKKQVKELDQENKQLKEEIEEYKRIENADIEAFNNYESILTELEEWLKEQGNNGIDEWGNHYTVCLYKLNKLKEKYK